VVRRKTNLTGHKSREGGNAKSKEAFRVIWKKNQVGGGNRIKLPPEEEEGREPVPPAEALIAISRRKRVPGQRMPVTEHPESEKGRRGSFFLERPSTDRMAEQSKSVGVMRKATRSTKPYYSSKEREKGVAA